MKFDSYEQFWLFYISKHRNRVNRTLHFCGSSLTLACILLFLTSGWHWLTGSPQCTDTSFFCWLMSVPALCWLATAPIVGYAFAWTGHFCFEGNTPATFGHPLWSLRGDVRMYFCMLTFQMARELHKSDKLYPPTKK